MDMLKGICAVAVLIGLVACGGGGHSTPPPTPTPTPTPTPAAAVTPSATTVVLGATQAFSTTLAGTVIWSINPATGSITQSGSYTAPASFPGAGSNVVTITATAGAQSATATATVVFPNDNHADQAVPVKLGTSGGNATDSSGGFCCSGTLGSLWTRSDLAQPFILSNNHVLDKSSFGMVGQNISQPGLVDSNCSPIKTVATLTQAAPLSASCTATSSPSCVDAAIAEIAVVAAIPQVDTTGSILDLGAAGSTSIAPAPPSNMGIAATAIGGSVAKSGRTTGLTCSTLATVSNVRVDYVSSCNSKSTAFTAIFNNQTTVSGSSFSAGGDSGSLIVDATNARPLALLFAGTTNNTVGNPIQDVINAFTSAGHVPAIAGGADHAVSCDPTATAQGATLGAQDVTGLAQSEVQRAVGAKTLLMEQFGRDPAISKFGIGKSADNPKESAVVVFVSGAPSSPIPALANGVRTRVIQQAAQAKQALLAKEDFDRGMALKDKYTPSMLGTQGVFGVGIGMSADNAPEPALIFFVDPKANHPAFPAIIEGMRTRIIEDEPFRAFGWHAEKEPPAGCHKK